MHICIITSIMQLTRVGRTCRYQPLPSSTLSLASLGWPESIPGHHLNVNVPWQFHFSLMTCNLALKCPEWPSHRPLCLSDPVIGFYRPGGTSPFPGRTPDNVRVGGGILQYINPPASRGINHIHHATDKGWSDLLTTTPSVFLCSVLLYSFSCLLSFCPMSYCPLSSCLPPSFPLPLCPPSSCSMSSCPLSSILLPSFPLLSYSLLGCLLFPALWHPVHCPFVILPLVVVSYIPLSSCPVLCPPVFRPPILCRSCPLSSCPLSSCPLFLSSVLLPSLLLYSVICHTYIAYRYINLAQVKNVPTYMYEVWSLLKQFKHTSPVQKTTGAKSLLQIWPSGAHLLNHPVDRAREAEAVWILQWVPGDRNTSWKYVLCTIRSISLFITE